MTIFTPREIQVIKYMIDGYKDFFIAEQLGIDKRQVSTHKNNARLKLGLERTQNDYQFLIEAFDYFKTLSAEAQVLLYTQEGIDTFHYSKRRSRV